MQIPARSPRRSARQIQELLDAFRSSGLSQAAFSRQHGIAQSLLSLHLKKARIPNTPPRQKPSRFLELERSTPSPNPAGCRITFPSGLLLDIPRHFQPAELSALLRLVAAQNPADKDVSCFGVFKGKAHSLVRLPRCARDGGRRSKGTQRHQNTRKRMRGIILEPTKRSLQSLTIPLPPPGGRDDSPRQATSWRHAQRPSPREFPDAARAPPE